MLTKQILHVLLNHAQKQSDASTKVLGILMLKQQKAEEKLNLLLEYRSSYQLRLQDTVKKGIDHVKWSNFITFINKLDAAVIEQRHEVRIALSNKEVGKKEFQVRQCKLKSYGTLSHRQQQAEIQQQAKYEQKQMDEYTSRRFFKEAIRE